MNETRLLTAFFDSRAEAERTIERLVEAGVPRGEIKLLEGSNTAALSRGRSEANARGYEAPSGYNETGFWASLTQLFMPDEDRHTYAEGLRRGGYLISLHVPDTQYERALDILDDEGTVDMEERTRNWQAEGWRMPQVGSGARPEGVPQPVRSPGGMAKSEEVIPIVEERLNVGKRETAHGRVRVRSYVSEIPVQERVNLRQEHVEVERRPVDRPVGAAQDAFRDRTIEATEHREQPVVSKQARVVEEVALRKEAETRNETVSDTVKKTRVEVQDDRNKSATGTGGGSPSPKRRL